MSTTLANSRIALSKDMGDYWASAATSAGAAGGTTIVDTALQVKASDWVSTPEAHDLITSGTYDGEERKISSLSTSTLTVLAHTGQIASAVTYEVHRMFTASDKRIALIAAATDSFPYLFNPIWDETCVSGNWLKDGSFEKWTSSTNLTYWTETTTTVTQTSTLPYYKHGSYSAGFGTASGTLSQSITDFSDLQFLRGKSVTFTCQGYCGTASSLRISINDGTTQTYSDYHAGDSAWTEDNPREDDFYVTQDIAENATQVTFTIHYTYGSGAVAYVDDARVISEPRGKIYIGHLGLAKNTPHRVEIEPSYYGMDEPWTTVRDWRIDKDGYLHMPTDYPSDYRLRIKGIGYLDFLASGVSSTAWTATIAVDNPQLKILTAQAALYLYNQLSLPNYSTGDRRGYRDAANFWAGEVARRKEQFGMDAPLLTPHYGVR